jgi:hypothetical protein
VPSSSHPVALGQAAGPDFRHAKIDGQHGMGLIQLKTDLRTSRVLLGVALSLGFIGILAALYVTVKKALLDNAGQEFWAYTDSTISLSGQRFVKYYDAEPKLAVAWVAGVVMASACCALGLYLTFRYQGTIGKLLLWASAIGMVALSLEFFSETSGWLLVSSVPFVGSALAASISQRRASNPQPESSSNGPG